MGTTQAAPPPEQGGQGPHWEAGPRPPDCCTVGYGERQPDNLPTIEHLTPKAQGGGEGDNIALACRRCNLRKGDLDALSYLRVLGRV